MKLDQSPLVANESSASSSSFNQDGTPSLAQHVERYAVVLSAGLAKATCLTGRFVAHPLVLLTTLFFLAVFRVAIAAARFADPV